MSPASVEQWVERYARRLWWGEYLRKAAEVAAMFLFVFGGLVLVAKLLVPQAWPHVLWLLAAAVPAAIAAWILARGRRWTRTEAAARLDAALATGGLLMTLTELPDAEWQARLPQLEGQWRSALPRLRPRRFAGYIALPLLFALGACFVPLRQVSSETLKLNSVAQRVTQDLEQVLEEIKEQKLLDPEEQKQLEKELKQLAQESQKTPLTHEKWETVDALRERLALRVEAAAQQISKAQALAEKLAMIEAGQLPELSKEALQELEKQLTDELQKLEEPGDHSPASKEEVEELRKKIAEKSQTPEDQLTEAEKRELEELRKQLAEKSQDGNKTDPSQSKREGLRDALQRLSKARERTGQKPRPGSNSSQERLDGPQSERKRALKNLKDLLEGEEEKLAGMRKKLCNGQCEGEGEGESNGGSQNMDGDGTPGKGGVNRGRADADLTYGDESDAARARFKESILPEGFKEQPKDDVVRLQRRDPTEKPGEIGPRNAARDQGPATGSTTSNRNLSPRHRNIVRKYFSGE